MWNVGLGRCAAEEVAHHVELARLGLRGHAAGLVLRDAVEAEVLLAVATLLEHPLRGARRLLRGWRGRAPLGWLVLVQDAEDLLEGRFRHLLFKEKVRLRIGARLSSAHHALEANSLQQLHSCCPATNGLREGLVGTAKSAVLPLLPVAGIAANISQPLQAELQGRRWVSLGSSANLVFEAAEQQP